MNISLTLKKSTRQLISAFIPCLAIVSTQGMAAAFAPDGVSDATSSYYDAIPPLLNNSASPLVMLAMSNDHELFKKAYTDYSDLDNDGLLDTTYNDAFEYYGYFNPNKCYDYSASTLLYTPDGDVTSSTHRCAGGATTGEWSGNFLNWVAMTRMDVVRKVLYGGKRGIDTTSSTILERAMIPNDIHAYVKLVDNADISGTIADYTPFTETAISICNTTLFVSGSAETRLLETADNPPLMRFASGAYPQWATAERVQCMFDNEGYGGGDGARPSNTVALGSGATTGTVINGSYAARVAVCVANEDDDADYCRSYVDSAGVESLKPVGLLQEYGESGALRFGLITGSYNNNTEGGVLRKNITSFAGTGGVDDELDLETGVFTNNTNSIVSTLDSMRVAGWNFSSGFYVDCDTYNIGISTFKSSALTNRQCRDWGNPLSEIYLEAVRYFSENSATAGATSAFATDDSSYVPGMNQAAWPTTDLLDSETACSNCAIVVLSTGLNTFDGDDLGSASILAGLSGSSDVVSWTERVGDGEGITGQSLIVGNADGGTGSNICSAKTLASGTDGLGGVLGLCPEIPQLEGSYHIAGLAYYANTSDLWPTLEGTQNIKTYAVALAENLPSFEIATSTGNTVSFVPGCQANANGSAGLGDTGWNDCSISNVTVDAQTSDYGRFLISWEDSHWGNDYDMDGIAVVEYCTAVSAVPAVVQLACDKYSTNGTSPDWGAASAGQIQIRVSVPSSSAGNALRFGFIMNGSDNDGNYINTLLPGGSFTNRLNGQTSGTIVWDSVRTFTAVASTGDLLQNPLWYAAKYGAFEDSDDSNSPLVAANTADVSEWDNENNITGASGADGVPDAFFKVSDPSNLVVSLENVFSQVSGAATSSSSAAVVANTAGGIGAIYQAIYEPEVNDENSRSVEWLGSVISYFIDDQSRFREDKTTGAYANNKALDAYDPIIEFDFLNGEPVFSRYDPATSTTTENIPFEQLEPIWNAADVLNAIDENDIAPQRSYSTSAANGRYIKTWIDGLTTGAVDGTVDDDEYIDFEASSAGSPFNDVLSASATTGGFDARRFLGFESGEDIDGSDDYAAGLVNFVRGIDQPFDGWRSRQLDRDNNGSVLTERLGDIVHSSPEVVGRPSAGYDRRYSDYTYAAYEERWQNRRQVVYVGGNSGMLHAFNAGFFQSASYSFALSNDGETEHPLGAELWAYIPQAALPHLQWLKEANYPHVYYVDGSVESFDVNIFDDDDAHPYGWGTILVATMRLGGGDITVDPNSDRADGDASDDITLRSAVMIFDVTNPESPPVLLAELTHEELGFTTSKPVVVKSRPADDGGDYSSSNDEWVLVFGSGPAGSDGVSKQAALDEGLSNQTARLFAVDISAFDNISWVDFDGSDAAGSITAASSTELLLETNSFVGDLTAMDWNNDFQDDVVYFGTAGRNSGVDTGHLFRMLLPSSFSIESSTFNYLLSGAVNSDDNQPFLSAPLATIDQRGIAWVFAGSGRLLSGNDLLTTQQLSFHGIVEPRDSSGYLTYASVDKDDLIDTTDIFVFENGSLSNRTTSAVATTGATVTTPGGSVEVVAGATSTTVDTYGQLRGVMADANGWFMDLGAESNAVVRRERNLLSPLRFRSLVVFDEYTPSDELCSPADGTSRLMALSLYTGTPSPDVILATSDAVQNSNGDDRVLTGIDLGVGQLVGISEHNDNIISQQGIKNTTQSPIYSSVPFGRRSWREIPYE